MAEWWQAFQRPSAPPKGAGTAAPVVLNPIQQRAQQVLDFLMGGLLGAGDEEVKQRSPAAWGELASAALPLAALMGTLKPVKAGAKAIKAYHGSPHDFDTFSTAKIGTGEGAQAYGHGLYFAEHEDTAKVYRDVLGGDAGRMYEVRINADPDTMLDWDKPLKDQPESVRESLRALMERYPPPDVPSPDAVSNILKRKLQDGTITGGEAYKLASIGVGKPSPVIPTVRIPQPAQASTALREAGIPGIKFLDQGSRAAGTGTRNVVVFDDAMIEILRKYGLLAPLAGAAVYEQQRQQTPNPLARVMTH